MMNIQNDSLLSPTAVAPQASSVPIGKRDSSLDTGSSPTDKEDNFNNVLDKEINNSTEKLSKTNGESENEDTIQNEDGSTTEENVDNLQPFAQDLDTANLSTSSKPSELENTLELTADEAIKQEVEDSNQIGATMIIDSEILPNQEKLANQITISSTLEKRPLNFSQNASRDQQNLTSSNKMFETTDLVEINKLDEKIAGGNSFPQSGKNMSSLIFSQNVNDLGTNIAKVSNTENLTTNSLNTTLTPHNGSSLDPLSSSLKNSTNSTTSTESTFILNSTVGSDKWNQQVRNRISWMGSQKITSAELKLHPAELGTMEIKISSEENQTKISFFTQNPTAKELIENSMPKLKELFNESGMQLDQGDVSHHSFSEKDDLEKMTSKEEQNNFEENPTMNEMASSILKKPGLNQVDHYV